jgi:hypothetical protein
MTDSRRAFQAMVWKEFREGLKWGVVGLILMIVGLRFGSGLFGSEMDELPGFPTGNVIGWSMLIGLILGLGQTIHESRGDRWGFLAHHPVSRTTLFWAKAAAGGGLYLLAVVLPIAIAIAVASRGIPFHPRLLEPRIVDLTCGLAFYFAGLLTGMRQARWYGTRALGLGLALVAVVVAIPTPHFWMAALASVVSLAILMAAAWGTFTTGGEYEGQPAVSRFALGMSILPGLAVVAGIAVAIADAFIPDQRPAERPQGVWTQHVVSRDGSILQIRTNQTFGRRRAADVRDLEGRPVSVYQDSAARDRMAEGVVSSRAIGLPYRRTYESRLGYRDTQRYFVRLFSDRLAYSQSGSAPPRWYYAHHLGLIEQIDPDTGHLGWLGPDGFSDGDVLPARRFTRPFLGNPVEYEREMRVLAFPDAIYRVNLEDRGVEELFRVPAGDTIIAATQSEAYDRIQGQTHLDRSFYVVVTTARIYVLGLDGRRQLAIARDSVAGDSSSVAIIRAFLTPDTATFAWFYPTSRSAQSRVHVMEFRGSRPTPVARYALPWDSTSMMYREYGERIPASFTMGRGASVVEIQAAETGKESALLSALTPPIVPVAIAVLRVIRPQPEPVPPRPTGRLPRWLLPLLAALISASIAVAIAQRFAFEPRRAMAWAVIGTLLGPLGVILMLAVLEWPALEPCPSCGKKRVVTREQCEHCGAPFSPPAADGTEVFEPAMSS